MEKATAAVLAGDREEAAFLFRIHEKMKTLSQNIEKDKEKSIPTISISNESTTINK